MSESILDTNILIAFLRGDQNVVTEVESYLGDFDRLKGHRKIDSNF